MRTVGWLFLGSLLTASCREPVANTATGNVDLTFANNLDARNPRIFRFQDLAGFLLVDPATNRFSLQAGTNRQFGCNDAFQIYSFMDVQQILHDPANPEAARIKEIRLGRDIYIAVYRDYDGWGASGFNCAALFDRKVAEGSGNFTLTDNDIAIFFRETNSSNAFGFVAQGRLQLVAGGRASYSGVSKCIWDGKNFDSLKCMDRINLK